MNEFNVKWTVIGAGPAGILAVGKLLDVGVCAEEILWVDEYFAVGDLGRYWSHVPSNTKTGLFETFLMSMHAFQYENCPDDLQLVSRNPHDTCMLAEVVKPLSWITKQLKLSVQHKMTRVSRIDAIVDGWRLETKSGVIFSKKVILAQGATPRVYPANRPSTMLPLTTVLNPQILSKNVQPGERVALFGSSHSAVLGMKNLLEAGCEVINYYRSPPRYAVFKKGHVMFDNTGLKGVAARWSRENLHGPYPAKLIRCHAPDNLPESVFHDCDQIVYATGFESRFMASETTDIRQYNSSNGIIAPGLYGLGIAYPEKTTDRFGYCELSVGLYKFLTYINKIFPLWLHAPLDQNVSFFQLNQISHKYPYTM